MKERNNYNRRKYDAQCPQEMARIGYSLTVVHGVSLDQIVLDHLCSLKKAKEQVVSKMGFDQLSKD